MAGKIVTRFFAEIVAGNMWKKLPSSPVCRGQTTLPKTSADQERIGIRFDYDTVIIKNGTEYHMFKMQSNAGKIPALIKLWRENNSSTHGVAAELYVKDGMTKKEVRVTFDACAEEFKKASG